MTIAEFLLRLASDSEFLARYREDAEAVVREAGLGAEQRALLFSGTLTELRVKIQAEIEVEGEKVAIHTIYTVPTIYIPPPKK